MSSETVHIHHHRGNGAGFFYFMGAFIAFFWPFGVFPQPWAWIAEVLWLAVLGVIALVVYLAVDAAKDRAERERLDAQERDYFGRHRTGQYTLI